MHISRSLAAAALIAPLASAAQAPASWMPARAAIAPLAADTATVAKASQAKSPSTAFWISFGTTTGLLAAALATKKGSDNAVPAVLATTAFVFGPAAGYWYGDSPKWKPGLTLRLIATGTAAAGAFIGLNGSGSGADVGALLAYASAGVIVVSAIVDIAKVDPAVAQANRTRVDLTLAPMIDARGKSAGLAVHLSF